jgi:hypothetical protein
MNTGSKSNKPKFAKISVIKNSRVMLKMTDLDPYSGLICVVKEASLRFLEVARSDHHKAQTKLSRNVGYSPMKSVCYGAF